MSQESCWAIYQALICLAGNPCDGQFTRQQRLTETAATTATGQIQAALPHYYDSPNGREYLTELPSQDNYVHSRRQLRPTEPTREEWDEIFKEYFWLKAAILLRQAQNHMRRPEFGYYMKTSIPVDRMMILQTFQYYILVCLGRGEIADPWLQIKADYVDTKVPDLNMIRMEWENARGNYSSIILLDSFWLAQSLDVQRTVTKGRYMRWVIGVLYQRSLLVSCA
ncbi:uncharacterized protein G6M90_00g086720 [Metarhizium brunneum]|uniref:Uncharacterized protein n=1 Tax=Metarhizium brunneum TaxID=500148 RepID=A0A7D5V1N1_9HYPO|nr:hypothetical protein G6M90_00g086720 [Metarhizium brunneum]